MDLKINLDLIPREADLCWPRFILSVALPFLQIPGKKHFRVFTPLRSLLFRAGNSRRRDYLAGESDDDAGGEIENIILVLKP